MPVPNSSIGDRPLDTSCYVKEREPNMITVQTVMKIHTNTHYDAIGHTPEALFIPLSFIQFTFCALKLLPQIPD